MLRRVIVGFWLLTLAVIVDTKASVVLSDDFSYPAGPLVLVSEGKWRTHSGTSTQTEISDGQLRLWQKFSEDVNAPFPTGVIGPVQALALYASFKVTFISLPSGVEGTYFAHFKDTTPTAGFRCRLFASTNGAAAGMYRIGVAAASSAPSARVEQDLQLHTAYRVVCRMLLPSNESTLWLDPQAESDPGVTSADEAVPKSAAAFAFRQSLASGAGMGQLLVDDLRVATTFAEVSAAAGPFIIRGPEDQIAFRGSAASFRVEASGTVPLLYQWRFNGIDLPDATAPVLVLDSVTAENAGAYDVVISNSAGSVTSPSATLTVQAPQLVLAISCEGQRSAHLRWSAELDQTYSVWAMDALTSDLSLLAGGLAFSDASGCFEDETADSTFRFYRLSSP